MLCSAPWRLVGTFACRVLIQTDEEAAAASFAKSFSDPTSTFADLLQVPTAHSSGQAADPEQDAQSPAGSTQDEPSSHQLHAKLLSAEQQHYMASAHACAVHAALLKLGGRSPLSADSGLLTVNGADSGAFAREHHGASFTLGMAVLEAAGCAVPEHIDSAATSALLRHILRSHSAATPQLASSNHLSPAPVDGMPGPSSHTKKAAAQSEGLDVECSCPAEAALAVKPVAAVQAQVQALLDRFEDQPLLLQLDAICSRILCALHPLAHQMLRCSALSCCGLECLLTCRFAPYACCSAVHRWE